MSKGETNTGSKLESQSGENPWDMSDVAPFKAAEKPANKTAEQSTEPDNKPIISESYVIPSEEVKKLDMWIEDIQRGEQSALLSNGEGRYALISEYTNLSEKNGYKNSEIIKNNPNLLKNIEDSAFDIAIVDATRGAVLEKGKNQYGKSIDNLFKYYASDKSSEAEKDLIENYFNQLDSMGNAFSRLLYQLDQDKMAQKEQTSNAEAFKDDDSKEEESEDEKAERRKKAELLSSEIEDGLKLLQSYVNSSDEAIDRMKQLDNLIKDESSQKKGIDAEMIRSSLRELKSRLSDYEMFHKKINLKNQEVDDMVMSNRDLLSEDDMKKFNRKNDSYTEYAAGMRKKTQEYEERIREIDKYLRRLDELTENSRRFL